MSRNKIIPSLWFCTKGGNVSEVVNYYKNIFGAQLVAGEIISLGKTPSGNTEMSEIKIFGQKYSMMSTEKKHHSFNDSVSFTIFCKNQREIDKYWSYFTNEGEESQCGWCMDKYGLRWQVIPENLGELMSNPDSWNIMMSQRKIVIKEYFK